MDIAVLVTGLIVLALLVVPYYLVAHGKKHSATQNPPSEPEEKGNMAVPHGLAGKKKKNHT